MYGVDITVIDRQTVGVGHEFEEVFISNDKLFHGSQAREVQLVTPIMDYAPLCI